MMTTPLTDTAGGQDALAGALAKAVPAQIAILADLPKLTLAVLRGQTEAALAEADALDLAANGDASWETLATFMALVRSIALDAYRPGGVTYLGMHWEATRPGPLPPAETVDTGGAL